MPGAKTVCRILEPLVDGEGAPMMMLFISWKINRDYSVMFV